MWVIQYVRAAVQLLRVQDADGCNTVAACHADSTEQGSTVALVKVLLNEDIEKCCIAASARGSKCPTADKVGFGAFFLLKQHLFSDYSP